MNITKISCKKGPITFTSLKEPSREPKARPSNANAGRVVVKSEFENTAEYGQRIKDGKMTAFINRGIVTPKGKVFDVVIKDFDRGGIEIERFPVRFKRSVQIRFKDLKEKHAKLVGDNLAELKRVITQIMYKKPVSENEVFTITHFQYPPVKKSVLTALKKLPAAALHAKK